MAAPQLEALLNGQRRALAQSITLIETGGPPARDLMRAVYPHSGQAHIVGITGAPGAGKSTLVASLALRLRARGHRVGIIAIDPTSPFSGGAILGDRIRMQQLGGDAGVFIRSMASRGRLGGIAHATADAARLLDAAGFDRVLIETVGAGQSEVAIAHLAHTTVVVEVPGMGDDVQAIKAGILEVADIFVVNKADREGADLTLRQLKAMLRLGELADPNWEPPVLPCVAIRDEGLAALADTIEQHRRYLLESGMLARREAARVESEFFAAVQELAVERLRGRLGSAGYERLLADLVGRSVDPYSAAEQALGGRP
jgi:LAO/AO transport system kinase